MRRIGLFLTFLPLTSCAPAARPTNGGASPAPSIDAACAAQPPASGMACRGSTYCVRAPAAGRDGVHCVCEHERVTCTPVVAQPLHGPCPSGETRSVLVWEDGVPVGYTCICGGEWACHGPPPG